MGGRVWSEWSPGVCKCVTLRSKDSKKKKTEFLFFFPGSRIKSRKNESTKYSEKASLLGDELLQKIVLIWELEIAALSFWDFLCLQKNSYILGIHEQELRAYILSSLWVYNFYFSSWNNEQNHCVKEAFVMNFSENTPDVGLYTWQTLRCWEPIIDHIYWALKTLKS